MLQFLLDEHISPTVCSIVRDIVLAATAEAGYTLVTYDLRTIPVLLHAWVAKGLSHNGVIFI